MTLSKFEQSIRDFLIKHPDRAFTVDELASAVELKGIKKFKALIKAIAFLEQIDEVSVISGHKIKAKQKKQTEFEGVFRANNKGYGFVTVEGQSDDLFIPPGNSGNAMHGDKVKIKILKPAHKQTGKGSSAVVIDVIERAANQMVGEFIAYNQIERENTGYLGKLIPQGDYSDAVQVAILPDGIHPADHTICIVKIKHFPTIQDPNRLVGYIVKEIGHKDEPGVDIISVLFQFGIPFEFPQNVMEEASKVPQEIDPKELKNRQDLRDQLIITIDGADAKDLDDAISLAKLDNGNYLLGVHIADVSHYVTEGSAMDREAFSRGTSVYLTDRVVPMLPQRLSNGICSLHAHEDRLTISCEMEVNEQGLVVDYRIFPSVIHSSYRMTYDAVNQMIQGDESVLEAYAEIAPMVKDMVLLHQQLETMRKSRGALDFDAPEAKIIVDEKGTPKEIQLRKRYEAERLIESFMLCANETVAKSFDEKKVPFMYRIHEQPETEKMQRFANFIAAFGLSLRGEVENIEPRQLQKALVAIKGATFEPAVATMLLRSMQQAKYSNNPVGHFGLAAKDYTHFTSPIRRYPDLIVHRLIRRYLLNEIQEKDYAKLNEKLVEIAEHSSKMERRAVDAERETDAIKKSEYMAGKIGEHFEGIISSITSFGMFVQLPNTVEGLVTLQSLKEDHYEFHPTYLMLIGKRSKNMFRIGQKVKVEVVSVNLADRNIDFELVDFEKFEPHDIPGEIQQSRSKNKKRRGSIQKSTDFKKHSLNRQVKKGKKQSHTKKRGRR